MTISLTTLVVIVTFAFMLGMLVTFFVVVHALARVKK